MSARKHSPEFIAFMRKRIGHNQMIAEAIKAKRPRLILAPAAQSCLGIKEKTGHNDGADVAMFQGVIGKAEREYWCMAFVQGIVAYAEFETGIESTLYASESCDSVWDKTNGIYRVKNNPLAGAAVIYGHYNSKGQYTGGHTGFVITCDESKMGTVEGNTSGSTKVGGIDRNGNGVYYNVRNRYKNGDMKTRGFLIPFTA